MHPCRSYLLWAAISCALFVGACDFGIGGDPEVNRAPDTELSVRDTSLVDNIPDDNRLASTVFVSWSGTDPDGYVTRYELRFYGDGNSPAVEEGWVSTSRNDSLILLPLEIGDATANVVFEVRAVDNEGAIDDTPARTVFPIRNSPPTLRFDPAEIPPDTTFGFVSIGWFADDPEGLTNLSHVEISLNDTVNYVALPAEVDFVTLVGDVNKADPTQSVAGARVYTGRSFQSTAIVVPGMLLGATNTLYARAVDLTDTTSVRAEFTWHVKKSNSNVLFVNDHRASATAARELQAYHLDVLREFLPSGSVPDVWDISAPYFEVRSTNLFRSADPTMRVMFADYDYIYWVTTNSTNSIFANNFPLAAAALSDFLADGGRIMVHSPVLPPNNPEENLGNPAVLLLPFSDFVTFPDSLLQSLRINAATEVTPSPGAPDFPPLRTRTTILNTFPFVVETELAEPLLEAEYEYRTFDGDRGPWTGPSTIASISTDRQVGLFALPMVNTFNFADNFVGADGDTEAPRAVIHRMLEMLEFPQ